MVNVRAVENALKFDVFVQFQSIFNSTNNSHGQSYPIFGFWLKYQPFLVYKRLNNEDIIYLLLHSTINIQNDYQYNDNRVTENMSNRQLYKAHFSCSLKDLEIT